MMRVALRCAVFVLLGFAVGLWLSRPGTPRTHSDSTTRSAEAADHGAEKSVANAAKSFERILELGQEGGGLSQDAELHEALKAMRAEDFGDAATRWTSEVQQKLLVNKVRLAAIIDRWFELDPASAKSFAEKECKPGERESETSRREFRNALAESAARYDLKWALDHLLHEPKSVVWDGPNVTIMKEVAKRDASLAKEVMARMENSNLRQSLLTGYVRGIAERDPLAALDIAISEKAFDRVNLISSVVEAAATQGKGLALEALAKIDDPALRRNSAIDALQVLAQETNTDLSQFINDTIGVENLDVIKQRSFALYDFIESNPAAAAKWAAGLPAEQQFDFVSQVYARWKELDPKGALDSVEAQTANASGTDVQGSALAELGRIWRATDLLNAGKTQEAIAALSNVTTGGRELGDFLWKLADDDPAGTGQWVLNLPEGKARETGAGTVAARWTPKDPAAVAEWIEKLPPGASRNAALFTMITGVREQDPESTSRWVSLYTDPQKQEISIRHVYGNWAVKDPAAAREWIRSLPDRDERWKRKFLRQNP